MLATMSATGGWYAPHRVAASAVPRATPLARALPFVCGLVAFAAYAATADAGVGWDDQAELAAGIDQLGSVHPTGYPIYLLLGKAFGLLLPFGSAALAASLFSALCGAVAVALVAHLVRRQTRSDVAAVAAACVLAGGSVLWANTVTASVYGLFLVSVLLLVLAALRWTERQTAGRLAWVSAAAGLVVVNHRMGLVFAAAAALYVLWLGRSALWRPANGLAALAALAPLASFSYVWLRTGSGVWPDIPTLFGLSAWQAVNGGPDDLTPGSKLFHATPSELVENAKTLVKLAVTQLSPAVLLLAPVGLLALRRAPTLLAVGVAPAAVASAIVLTTPMNFVPYHLPLLLMGAVVLGAGVAALEPRVPRRAKPALVAALAAVVLLVPVLGYRYVSEHPNDASAWSRSVLDRLPRDATIVAPWSAYAPLRATQVLEGHRPDVDVRYSPVLLNTPEAVADVRAPFVVTVAYGAVEMPRDRRATLLLAPVATNTKGIENMAVGRFGITAPAQEARVYALTPDGPA